MNNSPTPSPVTHQIPEDSADLEAGRRFAVTGRLTGKVALITGSSSGIGQAIAIRLAAEGAAVVIDYAGRPEGADDTKRAIEKTGGRAITVQADISRVQDTRKLIDEAYSQLFRCDILVNNAGVEKCADFWNVTETDYDTVLDVNLKGAFFLTQAFVQRLISTGQPGRVINISSVHEDMVFPTSPRMPHQKARCAC